MCFLASIPQIRAILEQARANQREMARKTTPKETAPRAQADPTPRKLGAAALAGHDSQPRARRVLLGGD
jgi:hypothetical protein